MQGGAGMSKLVRVEDIVKVVGMKNYIASLEMFETNLKYLGYQYNEKNQAVLEFLYDADQKSKSSITIDKKRNIKSISCDCSTWNDDTYCPHIALAIKYLFSNEDLVTSLIETLNDQKDHSFNQLLFQTLSPKKEKLPVNVSITLKQMDRYEPFVYELQIRIGEKKGYLLKKQLEEFLENYQKEGCKISFGTGFTYQSELHTIKKEDEDIFEFLKMYVDSQIETKAFYTYARKQVTTITLSKSILSYFLGQLKDHVFQVETLKNKFELSGIHYDFSIHTKLSKVEQEMKLDLSYGEIVPLTEDYSYIIEDGICYHLNQENRELLKLLYTNHKKSLTFDAKEVPSLTKTVLPRMLKLDRNLEIEESLKENILIYPWEAKFYFEKKKNWIVGHIHFKYENIEFDPLKKKTEIHYIYDKTMVSEWIQELYQHGFVKEKEEFVLKNEEDIIRFIEYGIYQISQNYDTMIEDKIKKMKVHHKATVQSSFKIGKDRILNYEFKIEHVDNDELSQIWNALSKKKKYVQLKSGDYLSLEQTSLQKLDQVYESLGITSKNIEREGTLPIYECIRLSQLDPNEFQMVQLDASIHEYFKKFQSYKEKQVVFDQEETLLRDYQMIGVKWMLSIAELGFGGILADEMGLGKSLQTIVYIKHRLKEDPNRKFLIVVPTSLVYNWENEWKKFAPHITYQVIHDTKEKRLEKLHMLEHTNVLITSYGSIRNDIDHYQKMIFDTCFLDEAQNIKNAASETSQCVKQIHALTKFALTGTPIENSLLELWSIFDYLMPGYLGSLPQFKRNYQIKSLEEQEKLTTLKELIAPFILRRKKSDVLKDLPPKIENSVYVELNDLQKQLYVKELEEAKKEIDQIIETDGFSKNQFFILSLLTKLRQLCIDPRLVYEDMPSGSKIETIGDLIPQMMENGHKILLFSQFPSALKLLAKELDKRKIKYAYLDGATKSKERMELVNAFNQNDQTVFLISLKAGGTGLNLTSADIVIHLDPWWNPQVENQATDRSHRIGQKNVVEVMKVIARGTIEEKIMELQKKKQKLSDEVIDQNRQDDILLSKLTEEDLMALLKGE